MPDPFHAEFDSGALVYSAQQKQTLIKKNMKAALRSAMFVLRAAAKNANDHPFLKSSKGYRVRVMVAKDLAGKGTLDASKPGARVAAGHPAMLAKMSAGLRSWCERNGFSVGGKSTALWLKAQPAHPWQAAANAAMASAERAFMDTLLEEKSKK